MRALAATFERRGTQLPSKIPPGLSEAFGLDAAKQQQWWAFIQRSRLPSDGLPLDRVVLQLQRFLMPVLIAAHTGNQFQRLWSHQAEDWTATQ